MENEMYVTCHGPSFSLLLYETVRSEHDQKGLLLGEVCREVISRKTDENEMNREQKTTIYLEHCVPIQDPDFVGNAGNVNKQKLQRYITQYNNMIVGWYSFRRNTRVTSRTIREMLIHRSFIELLPQVKPEYFIAAFMTASVGANFSTHTFNHIFMRYHPKRSRFEPLKFKIHTMSDKVSTANGYSEKYPFPMSEHFERLIEVEKKNESPKTSMLNINEAVNDYLRKLNMKLLEAEWQKNKLETQIKSLRQLLSLRRVEVLPEERENPAKKEREMFRVQYLLYDSDVNYNPDRKENPIKKQQKDLPLVPPVDRDGDAQRDTNSESDALKSTDDFVVEALSNFEHSEGEKPDVNEDQNQSIANHFVETGNGSGNGNMGGDGDNESKIESESNSPQHSK